jgi:hypothetical protein
MVEIASTEKFITIIFGTKFPTTKFLKKVPNSLISPAGIVKKMFNVFPFSGHPWQG